MKSAKSIAVAAGTLMLMVLASPANSLQPMPLACNSPEAVRAQVSAIRTEADAVFDQAMDALWARGIPNFSDPTYLALTRRAEELRTSADDLERSAGSGPCTTAGPTLSQFHSEILVTLQEATTLEEVLSVTQLWRERVGTPEAAEAGDAGITQDVLDGLRDAFVEWLGGDLKVPSPATVVFTILTEHSQTAGPGEELALMHDQVQAETERALRRILPPVWDRSTLDNIVQDCTPKCPDPGVPTIRTQRR